MRVPGACLGKAPWRWWVGAGACPAGNPLMEDAFTFPKPCSPPSAPLRGFRGGGETAPSGCSSLSVLGADKSETTRRCWGAVSKVRSNRRSVNLRPGDEPGKAGLQGCRHTKQGWWTCPPTLPPSIRPSLLPCSPCWGLAMGFDRLMNAWVGGFFPTP